MPYTPQQVANYFLEKGDTDGIALSPLKLVKLVYIAYGWTLALLDVRLFREPIQAWQHGPVVPSIYHEFKHFGGQPITLMATDLDWETLETCIPSIPVSDDIQVQILDKVWEAYKKLRGWSLRDMTHENDTPWARVYQPTKRNIVLRDEDISEHYKSRIAEYISASKSN